MAASNNPRDYSKRLDNYGKVAARIRAYDVRSDGETSSPSRAAIGPIPARLRPETVRFLDAKEPATKSRESPVPRRLANQLIPAASQQHECRPTSIPAFSVSVGKSLCKDNESSGAPDKPDDVQFDPKADDTERKHTQQAMPTSGERADANVPRHVQRFPSQVQDIKSEEDTVTASPKQVVNGSSVTAQADNSITAELQGLIDQSLKDNNDLLSSESMPLVYGDGFPRSETSDDMNTAHGNPPNEPIMKQRPAGWNISHDPDVPTTEAATQINPDRSDKALSSRFEVFLRERIESISYQAKPYRQKASVEDLNTPQSGDSQPRHSSAPITSVRTEQHASSRYWRWWKLILNETETENDQGLQLNPGTVNSTASQEYTAGNAVEQSNATRPNSCSTSPVGAMRSNRVRPSEIKPPIETEHQSSGLKRLSCRSLLHGNCVIRIQDVFGNGVLVDHDEIPIDALDSLNLLDTSDVVSTHHRCRRRQQLRQPAQLEAPKQGNQFSVPKEAIAPIMQNDGASSQHRLLQRNESEAQDATQDLRSSMAQPIVSLGLDADNTDEAGRPFQETIFGVRHNKVNVSIQDGGKSLVRIEIFPGKARVVVNETQG